MKRIVVVGAGEIGAVIAALLDATGDYRVSVVDRCAERLAGLEPLARVRRIEADGLLQTTALQIEDGRITAIYVVRNPDKLAHLEGAAH